MLIIDSSFLILSDDKRILPFSLNVKNDTYLMMFYKNRYNDYFCLILTFGIDT